MRADDGWIDRMAEESAGDDYSHERKTAQRLVHNIRWTGGA